MLLSYSEVEQSTFIARYFMQACLWSAILPDLDYLPAGFDHFLEVCQMYYLDLHQIDFLFTLQVGLQFGFQLDLYLKH